MHAHTKTAAVVTAVVLAASAVTIRTAIDTPAALDPPAARTDATHASTPHDDHVGRHVSTANHDDAGSATTQMQSLLGHHVSLAIRFLRATVTNDPTFLEAANASFVRHISDVEAALRAEVGPRPARRFATRWEAHTQNLHRYAAATRDGDDAARREAKRRIDEDIDDLSALIADMTDNRLPRRAAEAQLSAVGDLLTAQVDAYAGERYGRAYALQHQAYAAMFDIGGALAEAATGHRPGSVTYPPREQLQSALSKLLGEHVELAVDTMRAGVTGAPEFDAAAAALDDNTTAIADAMDSLFGPKRATEFNAVWADHIDLFVQYTVAVAEGDREEMHRIADEFDHVIARFGTTLARATNGRIDAAAVEQAMTEHEHQLFRQIEVYADGDYAQAHDIAYTAYQHIRRTAMVLGASFADAVRDTMPRGGADTGGGGTAGG